MSEEENPKEEEMELPPHADLPMGDCGVSKTGKRLLDPSTVKRMKDAGIPRPPEVSSLSWTQLQHLQVGRHHTIAYMAACGAKQKDIADAVGMSESAVCNAVNSEKMKFEIARLQSNLFGQDAKKRFNNLLPKAIDTIADIMNNEQAKDSIRLTAARDLVDRAVGKPNQKIEVGGSLIRQLYEKLDGQSKTIDTEAVQTQTRDVMEEIFQDCDLGANPNEVEHRDQNENPNVAFEDVKIDEWVGENGDVAEDDRLENPNRKESEP